MNKSGKFFAEYDGFVFRVALYCIFGLFLAQLFLFNDQTRSYLSQVDRLEGTKLALDIPLYVDNSSIVISAANQTAQAEHRVIVVRMSGSSFSDKVYVLVNGKVVGNLGFGELRIIVNNGDYIQIDATMLKDFAQYIIDEPDANLFYPPNHSMFSSTGNIIFVGKIKF